MHSFTSGDLILKLNIQIFEEAATSREIFRSKLSMFRISLDRHWGAFIVLGGPSGFSISEMPADTARMINLQFLVQRLNSMTVRYLIADDNYIAEDLDWAGFDLARCTPSGKRWTKRT